MTLPGPADTPGDSMVTDRQMAANARSVPSSDTPGHRHDQEDLSERRGTAALRVGLPRTT
jgi:hypothetical protein